MLPYINYAEERLQNLMQTLKQLKTSAKYAINTCGRGHIRGRACSTLKLWALSRLLAMQGRQALAQAPAGKHQREERQAKWFSCDAAACETNQGEERRMRHRVGEPGWVQALEGWNQGEVRQAGDWGGRKRWVYGTPLGAGAVNCILVHSPWF